MVFRNVSEMSFYGRADFTSSLQAVGIQCLRLDESGKSSAK